MMTEREKRLVESLAAMMLRVGSDSAYTKGEWQYALELLAEITETPVDDVDLHALRNITMEAAR